VDLGSPPSAGASLHSSVQTSQLVMRPGDRHLSVLDAVLYAMACLCDVGRRAVR